MASTILLSDNGVVSGSAGFKQTAGNDGVLVLQTTTAGGTPTTAISIDTSQNVTFTNQPTYTGGTANGVLYLNGSKAVTSGTALVFDGSNLGIGGASGSYRLTVTGATSDATPVANFRGYTTGADGTRTTILRFTSSDDANWALARYDAYQHIWNTNSSEKARLDASGNLGLGVTPSAWGATALELKGSAFIGSSNTALTTSTNAYYNGSNWIYKTTAAVTAYGQSSGGHYWYNAGSGTAGTSVSLTQAMTLDSRGSLQIGTTVGVSPTSLFVGGNISNNGANAFSLYSNSMLNSASNADIYITSNPASRYYQLGGGHVWQTAPSGTAGNTISYATVMSIDASGRRTNTSQTAFATYGTSGNWSVPTSGGVVPYDATPSFNVGSNYNSTTYTFTAPVAGKYFVSFSALIYPNSIPSSTYITLWASINGGVYTGSAPMARMSFKENQTTMSCAGLVNLAANDTVSIRAEANGSSSLTLYLSGGHAHFAMYLLG